MECREKEKEMGEKVATQRGGGFQKGESVRVLGMDPFTSTVREDNGSDWILVYLPGRGNTSLAYHRSGLERVS